MKIKAILFALLISVLSTNVLLADVVTSRGKASVQFTKSKADIATKNEALFNAQMKAIELFYAESGDAAAENLDAIRDKIKADPERYILETTVLNEQESKELKKYTVVVRVSLNGSNLRNALKGNAAVTAVPLAQRSRLGFVFVSRQVETQTTYDDRVTKRAVVSDQGKVQTSYAEKGSEGESIGATQISTNASINTKAAYSAKRAVSVETGGSSIKRAGKSTWMLIPSQNLSQVVTKEFKTSGYRVVEAQFIEPMTQGKLKVAAIENDYRSGNDLQSQTLVNIVQGLQLANIPYFALGTLDVGEVGTDPGTGLTRIAVTVNAKVINVSDGIPETVAVAGPAQYSGVGPTEAEAKTNALKLAAQNASRELTRQLANAGLQ